MIPELKEYLNKPSIRKLIEDEQYTQVLYHMEIDNKYNLMSFYTDLLFECGVDLTRLNYSGLVEELQGLFNTELDATVVLAVATNFHYESTWNEATLIYTFIYKDKCYSAAVDIIYDNKYENDWPAIFEDSRGLIIDDVNTRIRDKEYVEKENA